MHLLFPENYLNTDGQYFISVWGLDNLSLSDLKAISTDLGNGKVKVRRPCDQLTKEGLCGIYEHRPNICRVYRCDTRHIMAPADRCETDRRYLPLQLVSHE